MTAQFARTPYRGRSGGSTVAEPHAALLIDFDNVTMGIRSDLTKELKNLLNSDIIKGKVAVQRAYADWRRYPQYIVPLAESSVDLIFAPAYGSAKKNATDIRLAIDALELVFTRSEIGTFILLSGDSDFSSLVLKLKEYGKYVIGVGIRESASDLLVQNCDEYYSYSALTGLTRAGDEAPVISEDPWELVDLAVRQMIENDDVMRSDRLKQVLLEMDPAFDEKALGFQKFNKFLQEASTRGLLSLRKQENGQFEVGAASEGAAEAGEAAAAEGRESRRGRSRRGRGRRDEGRTRDERKDQLDLPERAATEAGAGPAAVAAGEPAAVEAPAAKAAVVVETRTAVEAEPGAATPRPSSSPRTAQDRTERSEQAGTVAEEPSAPRERPAARGADKAGKGEGDLAASYDLLRRAAADLVRKNGPAVRDSDVKRRMLELEAGWDESAHGFSKFSRFLRQAHDAQVVTLRRADGGNYDVLLGEGDGQGEAPAETPGGRRDRARGRGRERTGPAPGAAQVSEPPRRESEPAQTPAAAGATQATMAAERPARASAEAAPPAPAAGKATGPTVSRPGTSAAIGFRRGSRGRAAPAGPPPLLEGQTARVSSSAAAATDTAPAAAKTTAAKRARKAPAKKVAAKGTSRTAAKRPSDAPPAAAAKTAAGAVNAAALGLPTDAGEIANYITAYRGVGPRSVQSLIGAFGAGHVFEALETKPDAVREVMGAARADRLLEAWSKDVAARRAGDSATAGASPPPPAAAVARSGAAKKSARRGGRRGRGGQTAGK